MEFEKSYGQDAGGTFVEVFATDDAGEESIGRWYGPLQQCQELNPSEVVLTPAKEVWDKVDQVDPFDLACERRYD